MLVEHRIENLALNYARVFIVIVAVCHPRRDADCLPSHSITSLIVCRELITNRLRVVQGWTTRPLALTSNVGLTGTIVAL